MKRNCTKVKKKKETTAIQSQHILRLILIILVQNKKKKNTEYVLKIKISFLEVQLEKNKTNKSSEGKNER